MATRRMLLIVLMGVMGAIVVALPGEEAVQAQGDVCVAPYQAALDSVLARCDAVQPGTACATAAGVEVFSSGGIVSGPLNAVSFEGVTRIVTQANDDAYGIAVLQLPALEEDMFLTGVVYGDASLENAPGAPQAPECSARSLGSINVRAEPGTDATILGQLQLERTAPILARLADSSWWRILWEGTPAWIFADLAPADCDPATMLVYDLATGELSGGIPAPDFQGGMLESSFVAPVCAGLPQGGLLLQSPTGGATWQLNGVVIALDGSVLLQAAGNDVLAAQPLSGQVVLEVGGLSRLVQAGEIARVPLLGGQPDGVPGPVLESMSVEAPAAPLTLLPTPVEPMPSTLSVQAASSELTCSLLPQQVVQIPEDGIAAIDLSLVRPHTVRVSALGSGVSGLQIVDTPYGISGSTPLVVDTAEGVLEAGLWRVEATTDGAAPVKFGLTCDLPQAASGQEIRNCEDLLVTWESVIGGNVQLVAPAGARVSVLVTHGLPSEGPAELLAVNAGQDVPVGAVSFATVAGSRVAGPLAFEAPIDATYQIEWDGDPFEPVGVEVVCTMP